MSAPDGVPYRIVVLGADRDWVDEVATRCAADIGALVERMDVVAVDRTVPAAGDPAEAPPQALALFLADDDSRDREDLLREIEAARGQLIPVLPVHRPGADVWAVLPEALRALNAVAWERGGAHVTGDVARLLGLAEAQRRLFLSYRRLETSSVALQLREHLSRRAFDVFLDRFSVPPADDFQRRIDIELSDKAFVLLLESRSAVGSPWVQHEVAYALSHGISLLALCMPETRDEDLFASVDEAFRLRLDAHALENADAPAGPDDRVLVHRALDVVLDTIEVRYARQLRRRRTSLLGSLEQWLLDAGRAPERLGDERALAAHDPDEVFMITPRAPAPADLRRLDAVRGARAARYGGGVPGHLLFAAPVQDPRDRQLIDWIIDRRPLSARPHITVPDYLGL